MIKQLEWTKPVSADPWRVLIGQRNYLLRQVHAVHVHRHHDGQGVQEVRVDDHWKTLTNGSRSPTRMPKKLNLDILRHLAPHQPAQGGVAAPQLVIRHDQVD